MIGYILPLLVITLFIVFSALQIKEGKNDIKNSRRTKWIVVLQLIFGIILLTGSVVAAIVVLANFIVYK